MNSQLRVPCTYQGGKQRLASKIADILLESAPSQSSRFYDLCCGSGAISIELVNRGIGTERISMLDFSSWGTFWEAIGAGIFQTGAFTEFLSQIPDDKTLVKRYMTELAQKDPGVFEAEIYPIMQACSFGGKQIWWDGAAWRNAFFRDYWQPTVTSVRRSPANPMQPSPDELKRRVLRLAADMAGVRGMRREVFSVLDGEIPDDAVVYIDPPYTGTTSYGFDFDLHAFVNQFKSQSDAVLYVSESRPLASDAVELVLAGAKGGISGNRSRKHREWLTRF